MKKAITTIIVVTIFTIISSFAIIDYSIDEGMKGVTGLTHINLSF